MRNAWLTWDTILDETEGLFLYLFLLQNTEIVF